MGEVYALERKENRMDTDLDEFYIVKSVKKNECRFIAIVLGVLNKANFRFSVNYLANYFYYYFNSQ